MLDKLNIKLIVPPYMYLDEYQRLKPCMEIEKGRKIASLRIHFERAIGEMETYSILRETIPISMVHTVNQIFTEKPFQNILNRVRLL